MDSFEPTSSTSELAKELVKKEVLIFRRYQIDVKDIKCPLQWWEKHETIFLIVGFFALALLDHILNKKNFFLRRILTNFRICKLQTENLENLIFLSKNWPNDSKIECKASSNLVEIIEMDGDLEEELEQLEGDFERDEVFEL